MGVYFNPSNTGFMFSLRSKIYVDKSGIISYTNSVLMTQQRYVCVSRPRRFGKTMAADMLAAYYSCGCDSDEMFTNLTICKDSSYKGHLNQYNVVYLNIQQFLSEYSDIKQMIAGINKSLAEEILNIYPELSKYTMKGKYAHTLQALFELTKIPIVFIIDEWDCIFREYLTDIESQKSYLDFLRNRQVKGFIAEYCSNFLISILLQLTGDY